MAARFEWIRLMYLHPAHIDVERLVPLIKGGAICPYLDIPIQHASARFSSEWDADIREGISNALFDRLRSSIDDLVLRTTVMTGFPGETESALQGARRIFSRTSRSITSASSPIRPRPARRRWSSAARFPSASLSSGGTSCSICRWTSRRNVSTARLGSEIDDSRRCRASAGRTPASRISDGQGRFYGQAFDVDGVTYLKGNVEAPGAFVRARIVRGAGVRSRRRGRARDSAVGARPGRPPRTVRGGFQLTFLRNCG